MCERADSGGSRRESGVMKFSCIGSGRRNNVVAGNERMNEYINEQMYELTN